MRYPASEKLEIIRLVERSSRPAKWTLDKLGVPRPTFYRWYDRYLEYGEDGLVDRAPMPRAVWNRIPHEVRSELLNMALDIPELSPRELAVRFTDTKGYFVSESSVYRLLKAHDLISSPAFIVMKAASEFKDKTTAINQMWQTDFTYFKIIGWGWMYLSTVLDDFSRYIISWKLCSTMKTSGQTMVPVTYPVSLLTLSRTTVCHMYAAHLITRRPRAKSKGGIKHSRTAFYWKTTSCRETWNGKSKASWSITIIIATMRA